MTDGAARQKERDSPSGIISAVLLVVTPASMPAHILAVSQAVNARNQQNLLHRNKILLQKSAAHQIAVNPPAVKMMITTKELLRANHMGGK